MSFRVRIERAVQRKFNRWDLPSFLVVEAHLRIQQALSENPARSLVRIRRPFDGLAYGFSLIDPSNRLCEHTLLFEVRYGQDEETLHVVNVTYARRVG